MLPLQKQGSKQSKPGLYCSFHGDPAILQYLSLRVELTIIIEKPFVTAIPITPLITSEDWKSSEIVIEPLVAIEVFGENEKDFVINNKTAFKQNALYIYFPSNVQVDERVNVSQSLVQKMYVSSYQSIMREIPRQVRNNFAKLIIFAKGVGEFSLDYQKMKCSEMLSGLLKVHLQRRIEQYIGDISGVIHSQINTKSLYTIFKSKYGLAHIYRRIGVNEKAQQILELLWQDMVFNQRHFVNVSSSELLLLPPFIEYSYSVVLRDFFLGSNFLKICAFCFLKGFELDLQLLSYCEGLRTLKKFIEVSMNNITFSTRNGSQNTMLKNMWVVSIIEECYMIANRLGRVYPTFLNTQKEAEYHHLAVHIARTYRSSLEVVGAMLYKFDPQTNYPRSLEFQIDFCLERLRKTEQRKIRTVEAKQSTLLKNRVDESLLLIFGGSECFRIVYLKALVNFYEIMNRSHHYLRMARALKLLVLKSYLSFTKPEGLIISEQFLREYASVESDIHGFIEQIMRKAEKVVVFEQQQQYMGNALSRKMVRYNPQSDDYVNRNREDECLWPNLKFIQDYYKFIILLQAYRNQSKSERSRTDSSLSISFSIISNKIPIRTDNIIHLLLNENLLGLREQWECTLKLVREIFLLEKGEEANIGSEVLTVIRLGILLQAVIKGECGASHLFLKLNNQQLLNLRSMCDNPLIGISLLLMDLNGVERVVNLRLISQKLIGEGLMQLQFGIESEGCLIFIIKELQIRIGLILCYYVNKSIEIQEMKQLEENAVRPKKKSRKYSSFEEKLKEEEFVHMINKSEQLAMTYLHYNTFSIAVDASEEEARKSIEAYQGSPNRRDSFKRSVRSNSQFSLLSMMKDRVPTHAVFKNVWTPLNVRLRPNYKSEHYVLDVLVNKMLTMTSEGDEVSKWICINGVWLNRLVTQSYKVEFGGEAEVSMIVMVKSLGLNKSKDAAAKYRKQSEMSQSIFSNGSYERGDILTLKIEVVQQGYRYFIEGNINYVRSVPFEVKYFYCDQLQQYTLSNISGSVFRLKVGGDEFCLLPREQIKLSGQYVQLSVDIVQDAGLVDKAQKTMPEFYNKINLQGFIKKELLRPERVETFELSIVPKEVYKRMELIYIRSSVGGNVSFIDPGKGFELVGKVQGEVQVDENGVIDLYLLATVSGRLVLPRLLIDSKKGVWKQSIFVDVVE